MSLSENIKNTKICKILDKYEHYEHLKWDDIKTIREYLQTIKENNEFLNQRLNRVVKNGENPLNIQMVLKYNNPELAEMEYINEYKIYTSTLTSLYEMNAILFGLWRKEFSGYSNNAFYDFHKLVKLVNAYWEIETPYKPANKIAYGWKFSMKKADNTGYYCKNWKLYMWGCIKNYLIKNGVEFTKEESLKVRKIVGLADIYETTE